MPTATQISPQSRALARIRAFSRPLTLLISVVLGLSVVVPLAEIIVILVFSQRVGSLRAYLSFNAWGVGLAIVGINSQLHDPALTPVDSIAFGQRLALAGLAALCATCTALALIHLRALFALYSRGVVFAGDNVVRMKKFGLWFVVTAILVNVSGRLFTWVMGAPLAATTNAAMAVVFGAMIYVIAHVMELGREADLERKDFV